MDVNFELGDLKFIWDSDKDEINWRKHKVDLKMQREFFLMNTDTMISMRFKVILKTELKL